MKSLNKVTLIGRLTADPELNETKTGTQVCSIRVATNHRFKAEDGTTTDLAEFHDVTCWGGVAKSVCDYLKKGAPVFLEGRIKTNNWEDKDGQKRFKKEIVAHTVNFLDSPGQSSQEQVTEAVTA